MRIEELKTVKDRRPFEPFEVRMADGRALLIKHPDAVAWGSEHPRTLFCVLPGGEWVIIDVALVTSLGIPAPVPAPNGEGNGGAT